MTTENQEWDYHPVPPEKLESARPFAANYAGEHVAGTEFVIGAMFVAWGVGTSDVLWGLLWGNLLAVLSWGLICAPIAVQTRLTLYAYLERIGGLGIIKLYSLVNGVLFCVLAGAMITVSASAVRILFDIPAQTHWYPTSLGFVAVALVVGAVVVAVAVKGFHRVAQFAAICSPWMILMFVVGALALLPTLLSADPSAMGDGGLSGLKTVADSYIWRASADGLTMWHVAAFAWICNLAMHGGLSDMTVLRFARKASYGYLSALGMFIGHFMAWICAGVMGAGAALILKSSITELDAGAVAFEALGAAGIIAVIIAGWTTSNPTIYRAGLAFQSLNWRWNRAAVTTIAGVVTTIIACFPFVFTKLMDFVGLMGLILAPIGAVIVTEHWIFPRIGLTRYWAHYGKRTTNWPAVSAWGLSLIVAFLLNQAGVHLFFLLLPTWIAATGVYVGLAAVAGAKADYSAQANVYESEQAARREREREYLASLPEGEVGKSAGALSLRLLTARILTIGSLLACFAMALFVLFGGSLEVFKNWLIVPTLVYFVGAVMWVMSGKSEAEDEHDSVAEPLS